MDSKEFYDTMTDRVADWLRAQPEVDDASVERVNVHTVAAEFDGGPIAVVLQHDAG